MNRHTPFADNPALPKPILVTGDAQLHAMLQAFAGQPAVAVDTESNSLYAYYEHICLIQFTGRDNDYIVDPLMELDMAALGAFFADPTVQKVFHAAEQDVAGMRRDFGFEFANLFDTMWAARILGWPQLGLGSLLWEHFGVRTDKRYQRHNWGERPIQPDALTYARLDTHYLLALRDVQTQELEQMGRSEEAAEVFAQIAQTPTADVSFCEHMFWRIKGIQHLSKQEQAILWQLYLWRDEEAQRRDRPPFKIVGDRTLVELARRRPRTFREIDGIYGLKTYHTRRYGSQILQAISKGEGAQVPDAPTPNRRHTDAEADRFRALRAWRKRKAAGRKVTSDVVLPNAVLWEVAEKNPATLADLEHIDSLGPWKRKTYGKDILRVIRPDTAPKRQKKKTGKEM
ncbi:MAG: HRDC domain-containing protein [Anaerolineae bacterium]|nr:HRDC domain-containing protein [Anaerolineae bacterium]